MCGVIEFFDHSSVPSGNWINLFISKLHANRQITCVSGIILLINSAQTEIVPVKESKNAPWNFAIGSFFHIALSLMNWTVQSLELIFYSRARTKEQIITVPEIASSSSSNSSSERLCFSDRRSVKESDNCSQQIPEVSALCISRPIGKKSDRQRYRYWIRRY